MLWSSQRNGQIMVFYIKENGMEKLRSLIEQSFFGVCERIGERMGISTNIIRLYFIYTSFIAFGSPIILYLVLAFWVNIRKYFRYGVKEREAIF